MVKVGIEDVSEPHSYSKYTFLQCFLREPPIKEYQSNTYCIFLLIIIELRKRGEKERERGDSIHGGHFFWQRGLRGCVILCPMGQSNGVGVPSPRAIRSVFPLEKYSN